MNRTIAMLGILAVSAFAASAQSADEIVRSSRDRIEAKTTSSRSTMTIVAKNGTATERLVDQYSLDADAGKRTVIVFQKPASVAGTRFLTVEVSGRDDDQWIFLPSLGKVRRISSSEGSNSFMGTDFSYDDLSAPDRDVSEDVHRMLREENLDGADCWVIESVPKAADYQYSKVVGWIEKDTRMQRRLEMFDRRGELVKILEVRKAETIQSILTPVESLMTNVQAKTSTTVVSSIVKYDEKIPEGVFTTRFLETGRP